MAKENVRQTVRGILTDYLEQNNLRKTPERFAILDAIYAAEGAFTIHQLGRMMEEQHFPVSLGTLYNSIKLFTTLKLVVSHRLNNDTVYEASYAKDNLLRQVCSICGRMQDVRSPQIVRAVEETHLHRFRRSGFALFIYGTCSACQAKITRMKNKNKQKK